MQAAEYAGTVAVVIEFVVFQIDNTGNGSQVVGVVDIPIRGKGDEVGFLLQARFTIIVPPWQAAFQAWVQIDFLGVAIKFAVIDALENSKRCAG